MEENVICDFAHEGSIEVSFMILHNLVILRSVDQELFQIDQLGLPPCFTLRLYTTSTICKPCRRPMMVVEVFLYFCHMS